jgi:tetratricopeptide (TPR) repeat protein
MIRHLLLIPLVVCLLPAQGAYAENAEGPEQSARAACLAGDYGKGVAILSGLFAATHDPAFILGQGRCFEENQRCEDAIARFQEYLRIGKKLTKSDKADVQKHITECQELLAQRPATESAVGRGDGRDARERAAKRACLNGEADKGIKLLTDLYVDTNDSNYIFNQGRCYEQGSLYREAIERFREYLRKAKNATDAEQAEANRHIADCKAVLDGQKQEISVKVEETPPTTEPPQQVNDNQVAETKVEVTPAGASERPGSGLRVAGIVVASVGLAALATGVALNLKHNSIIRNMRTNYDDGTYATAGSYKTGAIVGYAAGAACIASSAILYVLGWAGRETTVTPTMGSDHAGLAVTGWF